MSAAAGNAVAPAGDQTRPEMNESLAGAGSFSNAAAPVANKMFDCGMLP